MIFCFYQKRSIIFFRRKFQQTDRSASNALKHKKNKSLFLTHDLRQKTIYLKKIFDAYMRELKFFRNSIEIDMIKKIENFDAKHAEKFICENQFNLVKNNRTNYEDFENMYNYLQKNVCFSKFRIQRKFFFART